MYSHMKFICYCGVRTTFHSIASNSYKISLNVDFLLSMHQINVETRSKIIRITFKRSSSTIISDAFDSIVIPLQWEEIRKKFQSPESHTNRFYRNHRLCVFIFVQKKLIRKKVTTKDTKTEIPKKTNQRETPEFIWSLLLLLFVNNNATPMPRCGRRRHRTRSTESKRCTREPNKIAYLDLSWKGRYSHKNNRNVWHTHTRARPFRVTRRSQSSQSKCCVRILCARSACVWVFSSICVAHVEAIHRFSPHNCTTHLKQFDDVWRAWPTRAQRTVLDV